MLVREEVLLASLCERKILFRLKIYDRLRQVTAKRMFMACRLRSDWRFGHLGSGLEINIKLCLAGLQASVLL